MNKKMYLPASCILVCAAYLVVADTDTLSRYLVFFAAFIFAALLFKSWRDGR